MSDNTENIEDEEPTEGVDKEKEILKQQYEDTEAFQEKEPDEQLEDEVNNKPEELNQIAQHTLENSDSEEQYVNGAKDNNLAYESEFVGESELGAKSLSNSIEENTYTREDYDYDQYYLDEDQETRGSEIQFDTFEGSQPIEEEQVESEDLVKIYYEDISLRGEEEEEEGATVASSLGSFHEKEIEGKLIPFNMKWCFGLKKSIPIINLTTTSTYEIFYACSHFGVVYDYRNDKMKFLPGHQNSISSISADSSGRWLTVADVGNDHVITIWDKEKMLPCWTIFNPFPNKGTRCCIISPNAKYIVASSNGQEQTIKYWLWTYGNEEHDGTILLKPEYGKVKQIIFNPKCSEQFMITLETKVIFVDWDSDSSSLKFYEPKIRAKGKIGAFTESVYLEDNHQAISATTRGLVVLWSDTDLNKVINNGSSTNDKQYIKTVQIQNDHITCLRLVDGFIVTAALNGTIYFHDQNLKLLYWIPKFNLDPISCVSFHLVPRENNALDPFQNEFSTDSISNSTSLIKTPTECSLEQNPLLIRDFVFLTTTGKIGYISHAKTKMKYFLYQAESYILSLASSPTKTHIISGNALGRVVLYNFITKEILLTEQISPCALTYLTYNKSGSAIAAGSERGDLLILDANTLNIQHSYENTRSAIKHIRFSQNDQLLAHSDCKMGVCLYSKNSTEKSWIFIGKCIPHSKTITDLLFEENLRDPEAARLFSIGEDRSLVEYDTNNLVLGKLNIVSIGQIEQSAIPVALNWLPNVFNDRHLIISTNEFKMKIFNVDLKKYCKTTLGPTGDCSILRMINMPQADLENKQGYMVYQTSKSIGIKLLPMTGNPFEHMSMVGHAEKLINTTISCDGKYAFTIGVNDCSIIMWKINLNALRIGYKIGGEGLDPFLTLVDNNTSGFLFHEMEDYFYLAQMLHVGEHANVQRVVSEFIPLCELPDLMRALGFYPSEIQIQNMLYEVSHRDFHTTGNIINEITFEEYVKVFLNHRPVVGVTMKHIMQAFAAIARIGKDNNMNVSIEDLYNILEDHGEMMSSKEIKGYLSILLTDGDDIPREDIPIEQFANDCLGIDFTITEEEVLQIIENK